jgi:hypothetical protein
MKFAVVDEPTGFVDHEEGKDNPELCQSCLVYSRAIAYMLAVRIVYGL